MQIDISAPNYSALQLLSKNVKISHIIYDTERTMLCLSFLSTGRATTPAGWYEQFYLNIEVLTKHVPATMKLDTHKNGWKGVCVYQETNGDLINCPVRALGRR